MAELILDKTTSVSTPSVGKITMYASNDPTGALLRMVNDMGKNIAITGIINSSIAAQSPVAATRTYITGSALALPASKQIGTIFRWKLNMTKTAAGIAASTFDIAFGTTASVTDVAVLSFTKPAGTAVADEAWVEIVAILRGPLSASCIVTGEFTMIHNLQNTGHAAIPCVVVNTVYAGFNITTPTYVGLCITTGAGDVITIQQVTAEALNL
jgi:hypothetical protein